MTQLLTIALHALQTLGALMFERDPVYEQMRAKVERDAMLYLRTVRN